MAEGLFREVLRREGLEERFCAASAGTMPTMVGSPPDKRASRLLGRYGIDITACRAECIDELCLDDFGRIFVMDRIDLPRLLDAVDPLMADRVHLVGEFLPGREGADIADPYYGGEEAFEQVCSDLSIAAAGIADFLRNGYPEHREGSLLD